MLTRERLTGLHRDLKDTHVLSVYLDADQHDPAQRGAWRTRLDAGLSGLQKSLEEEGGDVEGFLAAKGRLERVLKEDGFLSGAGWVAFVGPDELYHAGPVPFRVPTLVRWSKGPNVTPYFKGMRHQRPVVVVVADRRRARFLQHREGDLVEGPGLVAFADLGDVSDAGVSRRASTASGVRGATGKDLAERFLRVEAERLHQEVLEQIRAEAGSEALILIAGPAETASKLHGMLSGTLAQRAAVVPGIAMDDTIAEMRPKVTQAVRELAGTLQDALLDRVLEGAHRGGRGLTGTRGARKALRENRADLLLVSSSLLDSGTEIAEQMVGAALDHSTDVEFLAGSAASRLDEVGEGLAVMLRY